MTYGVDECRVCGKTIRPPDGKAMQRYLRSVGRPPTMTEREWRAAGFKAAPTRAQMFNARDGCCFECQFPIRLRNIPMKTVFFSTLVAIVFLLLVMFFVGSLFT